MAISARLVGKGAAASSSTTTAAGTSSASGSTFLVGFSYDASTTVTSVTDSKSNTYTKVGLSYGDGGARVEWWASQNAVGGASHTATVTFSGAAFAPAHLIEVLGAEASGIDVTTGRSNVAQHDLIISVGPFAQADGVVLAIVGANDGGSVVYSDTTATFTKLSEEQDGNNFWTSAVWSRVVASTAAITTGFSNNQPGGSFLQGSILSIKQAAAGGGGPVAGAMSASESGSDAFAGAGTIPVSGALSAAEVGADTFAGSGGAAAIVGALAASESGQDVFAAAGGVVVAGSLVAAEVGADTFATHSGNPTTGKSGIDVDVQFTGTTPLAAALGTTKASGSAVVVMHGGRESAHATPTDTKGNAYNKVGIHIPYTLWGPDFGVDAYVALDGVGGDGHTVNSVKTGGAFNESEEATFIAVEVENGAVLQDWTQHEMLKDTGPLTHQSVTVTGPATLVAGWWGDDGGGPHTAVPDNGFSVVQSFLSGVSGSVQGAVATRDVTAAGTYTTTWTETPNQGAILFLIAIQGVGTGGGSLAATEDGVDTFAASGAVLVAGTMSVAEVGSDAFAGAGTVLVSGAFAASEAGADSFAATGAVLVSGALSAPEVGADAFTGVGSVLVAGALSAAESGQDAFAGAGTLPMPGTMAAFEFGSDTLAASGAIGSAAIVGAMAAAEAGADAFAASGAVLVAGAFVAAEVGADTLAAAGSVLVAGSLSAVETGADTFAAGSPQIVLSVGTQYIVRDTTREFLIRDTTREWRVQ